MLATQAGTFLIITVAVALTFRMIFPNWLAWPFGFVLGYMSNIYVTYLIVARTFNKTIKN